MASRIKLLPDTVANQIAAGEVVNRPASVVKEMMENAVDAGAKCITVRYRNGGKELIHIVDDGSGMSPTDARLAFDKHATSKITQIDDVYKLHTFGFRGEALASIAAIARVELTTRQPEDELAIRIVMEGSHYMGQETVVAPLGSQFAVQNLFYNVPARRRVLEKSATEHRHIAEEFRRVALCHPEISFYLYGEDAPVYNLPAVESLKLRIASLMGKSVAANLLEVGTQTSIVKIYGFVGRPSSAKQNNREQYMFVNGRYFRSQYFHKAVVQAYEKLIPAGTQPSYFLYFEVEADKIDVNIHPQKIEVRFEEGVAIWQILNASAREALAKTGSVPLMDFDDDGSVEIPGRATSFPKEPATTLNPYYNPFAKANAGTQGKADISAFGGPGGTYGNAVAGRGDILSGLDRDKVLERFDESVFDFIDGDNAEQQRLLRDDEEEQYPSFRGALPLGGGYLATSLRGNLVVIDLRRAKEAILFDRYTTMLDSDTSITQRLLFPEIMVFSNDDTSILKEHSDDFAALGFEYSVSDDNRVEITGIPADFTTESIQPLVYDMIDCLREETQRPADLRRKYMAAVMSRGGARSLAKTYSDGETTAILELLDNGQRYGHTHDGRPVTAELNIDQLKKLFI